MKTIKFTLFQSGELKLVKETPREFFKDTIYLDVDNQQLFNFITKGEITLKDSDNEIIVIKYNIKNPLNIIELFKYYVSRL